MFSFHFTLQYLYINSFERAERKDKNMALGGGCDGNRPEQEKLSDTRKGIIAYLLLLKFWGKRPMKLNPADFKREVGNLAAATKLSQISMQQLLVSLVQDLVDRAFSRRPFRLSEDIYWPPGESGGYIAAWHLWLYWLGRKEVILNPEELRQEVGILSAELEIPEKEIRLFMEESISMLAFRCIGAETEKES